MKSSVKLSLLAALLFFQGSLVAYADITIQPLLINESAQARDTIAKEVTLSNTTNRKLVVYATVNEISLGVDGDIKEFVSPVMSDRTDTITSWTEISRGRIELMPGEEKKIPLKFKIHPYAEPGEYYAFIGFVPTSKRPDAEAIALDGQADGVVVNLTIDSAATESLTVSKVDTKRFQINPENEEISVLLENDGDLGVTPEGEVIFYNTRGVEIGAADLNPEKKSVGSGERLELTVPVEKTLTLGRYKANVNVIHNSVSILDTTQFYVVPLLALIIILISILLVSFLVTFLIRRSMGEHIAEEDGHEVPLYDNTGINTTEDHDHDITLSK